MKKISKKLNCIVEKIRGNCKLDSESFPPKINNIIRYMKVGAACFIIEHVLLFFHDAINIELIRFSSFFIDILAFVLFILFTSFLFIFITIGIIGLGVEFLEILFSLGIDSAPIFLFFGITNIYIANGILNKKRWAFKTLLVIECLNLIINILALFSFHSFYGIAHIIKAGLAIFVIYCLLRNKSLFYQ